MTRMLSTISGGKCVVALEGGYNLKSISVCMSVCAKALLGDPIPPMKNQVEPK